MTTGVLDMGEVMVGEVLHGKLTLTNSSPIDLQYSMCLLSEVPNAVQSLTGNSEVGKCSLELVELGQLSILFEFSTWWLVNY